MILLFSEFTWYSSDNLQIARNKVYDKIKQCCNSDYGMHWYQFAKSFLWQKTSTAPKQIWEMTTGNRLWALKKAFFFPPLFPFLSFPSPAGTSSVMSPHQFIKKGYVRLEIRRTAQLAISCTLLQFWHPYQSLNRSSKLWRFYWCFSSLGDEAAWRQANQQHWCNVAA